MYEAAIVIQNAGYALMAFAVGCAFLAAAGIGGGRRR